MIWRLAEPTKHSQHLGNGRNVLFHSHERGSKKRANAGGAKKGEEIFRYLLAEIAPTVLIVHGAGSVKDISPILKMTD